MRRLIQAERPLTSAEALEREATLISGIAATLSGGT